MASPRSPRSEAMAREINAIVFKPVPPPASPRRKELTPRPLMPVPGFRDPGRHSWDAVANLLIPVAHSRCERHTMQRAKTSFAGGSIQVRAGHVPRVPSPRRLTPLDNPPFNPPLGLTQTDVAWQETAAAAAAKVQERLRERNADRKEVVTEAAGAAEAAKLVEQQRAVVMVQARVRGVGSRKGPVPVVKQTDELAFWHRIIQRKIQTRFSGYLRCFRMVDLDKSGQCDKYELKTMLNAMFTLNIPDHVMEELVQLADIDGDGAIRYAEFARVFSADDIRSMKKTLRASGGSSDYVDGRKPITHEYILAYICCPLARPRGTPLPHSLYPVPCTIYSTKRHTTPTSSHDVHITSSLHA